jgi:hypothetical protein
VVRAACQASLGTVKCPCCPCQNITAQNVIYSWPFVCLSNAQHKWRTRMIEPNLGCVDFMPVTALPFSEQKVDACALQVDHQTQPYFQRPKSGGNIRPRDVAEALGGR